MLPTFEMTTNRPRSQLGLSILYLFSKRLRLACPHLYSTLLYLHQPYKFVAYYHNVFTRCGHLSMKSVSVCVFPCLEAHSMDMDETKHPKFTGWIQTRRSWVGHRQQRMQTIASRHSGQHNRRIRICPIFPSKEFQEHKSNTRNPHFLDEKQTGMLIAPMHYSKLTW